jgi:hypothetical protein
MTICIMNKQMHTCLTVYYAFLYLLLKHVLTGCTQWLRHCAANWKVAGSIPDGVIGIFHRHNPSGCTMALG